MIDNLTVRWFELKDKKLYLCRNVIASMLQLSSEIYERVKYQFISNSLARVCGLMSLLMGNRWQELCLFFNGYYFSTDYKKIDLEFSCTGPRHTSNQLFLKFDKQFLVNKKTNRLIFQNLGILREHVILENFNNLWETVSELSDVYISSLPTSVIYTLVI